MKTMDWCRVRWYFLVESCASTLQFEQAKKSEFSFLLQIALQCTNYSQRIAQIQFQFNSISIE